MPQLKILLLIVTLVLIVLSSWNLNTFLRLSNASKSYSDKQGFEDVCHVSDTYVKGGKMVALVVLSLSILLLGVELWIFKVK